MKLTDSSFVVPAIIGAIIGFPFSVAANGVWQLISLRLPTFSRNGVVGVHGFWLAKVNYTRSSHGASQEAYDLFRIKR
jgi:hypothetical protein